MKLDQEGLLDTFAETLGRFAKVLCAELDVDISQDLGRALMSETHEGGSEASNQLLQQVADRLRGL